MAKQWEYLERQPGSKLREPVPDEFFNDASIRDALAAFVREAVQNILDATWDKGEPAWVRFYVSGDEHAVPPGSAARYFEGIWPHLQEAMPEAAEHEGEPCRYLVVEDFNTGGLRGDPAAWVPDLDDRNDFFYFFRAEGKSGKSGSDRGRWGIGKLVFPRASGIRAFFGLTVRAEDHPPGPLLMGQAIAPNHTIDGTPYEPDGWWGKYLGGVHVPVSDRRTINAFKNTWNVVRADDDPGLSIVIPFVVANFDAESLIEAIIQDYFIAILTGELVASVEDGDYEPVQIDHESLPELSADLDDEIRANVTFINAALDIPESHYVQVKEQDGAPAWEPDLVKLDDQHAAKAALAAGELVAFRVPVRVEMKNPRQVSDSYFDVFLQPEPGRRGHALFAREGLIVPRVMCPISGVRAAVLIREESLARMLGDAEGPAHVDWSARSAKFTGNYAHGRDWISFVKKAPAELLRIVQGEEDEEDPTLAADLFSVPAELLGPEPKPDGDGEDGSDEEPTRSGHGQPSEGGAGSGRREGVPPERGRQPRGDGRRSPGGPSRRRIQVSRIDGGFAVEIVGEGAGVETMEVAAAYDVRRGDPFQKWSAEDFKLSALQIEASGGQVIDQYGNTLTVRVDDQGDFRLQVRGFDANRDLKVRARRGGAV
ncbi:hypothetical protein EV385_3022 [Krasilnikovia cinnamomea]|uniref:Uncharacterized protein n=1 Tax=Krasilnikovia cinnamomea TaxID=349313 RepID=A0A4Q7ZLH4_9ACTN|nr:hypothetical protein [Krasilnikovia cinnamomea]RZU51213.1 hypothetical protein EV385_3022 [Krasilnikovia cinnamomea]